MTNDELARRLRDHASGLARLGNNLYRVRAFRQAALAVSGLPVDVEVLVGRDGGKALEDIPGIGPSLARTIASFVKAPATASSTTC